MFQMRMQKSISGYLHYWIKKKLKNLKPNISSASPAYLAKSLAKDVTVRVHSEEDYNFAVEASELLFGRGTSESLQKLSEQDLQAVFEGVPQVSVPLSEIEKGVPIIDFLSVNTNIFPSKGEAKKMLAGGGVFINKEKMEDLNYTIGKDNIIKEKYILAQKGKKNYYLITVI